MRKSIRDITHKFQVHPLWRYTPFVFFYVNYYIIFRMVHIAIACSRVDVFTDDGLNYLKSIGYLTDKCV